MNLRITFGQCDPASCQLCCKDMRPGRKEEGSQRCWVSGIYHFHRLVHTIMRSFTVSPPTWCHCFGFLSFLSPGCHQKVWAWPLHTYHTHLSLLLTIFECVHVFHQEWHNPTAACYSQGPSFGANWDKRPWSRAASTPTAHPKGSTTGGSLLSADRTAVSTWHTTITSTSYTGPLYKLCPWTPTTAGFTCVPPRRGENRHLALSMSDWERLLL